MYLLRLSQFSDLHLMGTMSVFLLMVKLALARPLQWWGFWIKKFDFVLMIYIEKPRVPLVATSLSLLIRVWSGVTQHYFDPDHSFYERDLLGMMMIYIEHSHVSILYKFLMMLVWSYRKGQMINLALFPELLRSFFSKPHYILLVLSLSPWACWKFTWAT